jgi:hypothetical protein
MAVLILITLSIQDNSKEESIDLTGIWKYKLGSKIKYITNC